MKQKAIKLSYLLLATILCALAISFLSACDSTSETKATLGPTDQTWHFTLNSSLKDVTGITFQATYYAQTFNEETHKWETAKEPTSVTDINDAIALGLTASGLNTSRECENEKATLIWMGQYFTITYSVSK